MIEVRDFLNEVDGLGELDRGGGVDFDEVLQDIDSIIDQVAAKLSR